MKLLSPVLITGASGFVGSHLAENLAQKNIEAKLLVRQTSRLPFSPSRKMKLCYGDVTDFESVQKAVRGVRCIYHLAGVLRGSNFETYRTVNAEGTRNVCRAAEGQKSVRRLVYVSSLSAAGPSPVDSEINETIESRPVSYYGQSKLLGETIVLSYQTHFPVTILRPGAVYGPRDRDIFEYFKMVKRGLVLIAGGDSQKISFVHVLDLVDAILRAAHSPKAVGRVYFVSDGRSYNWCQFAENIGKTMGKTYLTIKVPVGFVKMLTGLGDLWIRISGKSMLPPVVSRDKMKEAQAPGWVCSNRRICRELGFKPKFDLEKGIQNTVDFYRSSGWI
jgi:dihydroflavonol-4-reductase